MYNTLWWSESAPYWKDEKLILKFPVQVSLSTSYCLHKHKLLSFPVVSFHLLSRTTNAFFNKRSQCRPLSNTNSCLFLSAFYPQHIMIFTLNRDIISTWPFEEGITRVNIKYARTVLWHWKLYSRHTVLLNPLNPLLQQNPSNHIMLCVSHSLPWTAEHESSTNAGLFLL